MIVQLKHYKFAQSNDVFRHLKQTSIATVVLSKDSSSWS